MIVALLVFLGIGLAATVVGHALGIPPVDDGPWDGEAPGVNVFGFVTFSFSALVALWAGLATYERKIDPSRSASSRLSFLAWLTGLSLAVLADGAIRFAFGAPRYGAIVWAMFACEVGAFAVIGWAVDRWRRRLVRRGAECGRRG